MSTLETMLKERATFRHPFLARSSDTRDTRGQLMRQASRVLMADYAVTPMHYYVSGGLVETWVGGWQANPYDVQPTRFMGIERLDAD